MSNVNTKREETNGRLLAAFLFQYSLLIPLMGFISSSILVAISGLLLMLTLFLRNIHAKIEVRIILFFLCALIILFLKVIISNSDAELLSLFTLISAPAMFMFLYRFSYESFITTGYKLAVLNFFVVFTNPLWNGYNYMRFGYGILLTVMFLYIRIVYLRKRESVPPTKGITIFEDVIFALAALEMTVYGSRGALFAFIIFVVVDRLFINKKKIVRNIILILLALAAYLNLIQLLNLLEKISIKVGLYSYSVTKLKMQLVSGFNAASSGRDKLYKRAIGKIKEHLFFGNEITIDEEGGNYVHNLFLQVTQDLGLFALIVLVAFLVYVLIRMWRDKTMLDEKIVWAVLFSLSIGRLMFSSTLWRRPELWMLIAFAFSIRLARRDKSDNTWRTSAEWS